MLEEEEFRLHTAQRRDKEQQAGNDERLLTTQIGGQHATECRTDDATDECRSRGEAMPAVVIIEIGSILEEGLQTLLST